MKQLMSKLNLSNLKKLLAQLFGVSLFSLSFNLLIVPQNLYSGNVTGLAQVINDLIHMVLPSNTANYTGTILLCFNIPLFVLAYRKIGKGFTIKTIIATIFMSAMMQFIPIPDTPVIEDILTSSILAGIICGFGSGITLRNGGSAGGTDILGLYFVKKYPDFSIGKLQNIISAAVFTYCLFRYDVQIVIYSAICLLVTSFVLDRTHTQNIKSCAIIFTKNPAVKDCILNGLNRGATCWEGYGCYNQTKTYIFMTIISKYEIHKLKEMIHVADPNAFITFNNNIDVDGNFIKRL